MDQRGSAAIESAILIPAFIIIFTLIVGGWRIEWTRTQVQEAASAAARAASLQRSAGHAYQIAEQTAQDNLETSSLHCLNPEIAVDTSEYARPPEQPATVHVTIKCLLDLTGAELPDARRAIHIYASASERVDCLRSREP